MRELRAGFARLDIIPWGLPGKMGLVAKYRIGTAETITETSVDRINQMAGE